MLSYIKDYQPSKWLVYAALAIVIISNSLGNLMLKLGADTSRVSDRFSTVIPWQILIGMSCFAFGLVVYTWVLSHVELHRGQIIISLQYVLVILLASWYLGESVSLKAWIGICFIFIGIILSTS